MNVIPKWLADFGLWVNRFYYKQLLVSLYNRRSQPPAWFDHRIDLYYHWPHNLFWLERGIVTRMQMFSGCRVLDLFCGDGFYSRYFYSTIAGHIDAVDADTTAIKHARRWHSNPKIIYYELDVVKNNFPDSHYDVVVWCEAIEHLDDEDYTIIVKRIKGVLGQKGILVGSTPIVNEARLGKGNWQHKNEFTSVEKLSDFLNRDFNEVQIYLTTYPELGRGERQTAYFTLRQPK